MKLDMRCFQVSKSTFSLLLSLLLFLETLWDRQALDCIAKLTFRQKKLTAKTPVW